MTVRSSARAGRNRRMAPFAPFQVHENLLDRKVALLDTPEEAAGASSNPGTRLVDG